MTRDEAQKNALDLSNKHTNLLLCWSTGVGKSLAAIKILAEHTKSKCYIIVAEIPHIQNWIDEFKKHGYESLLVDKVEIFCYASLHKYHNTEVDVIVLDEVHNALSFKRTEYIKSLTFNKIIGLSATLDDRQQQYLNFELGDFYTYTITLEQAIKGGLIPKPDIYLVPLELDDLNVNQVHIITKGKTNKRKIFECVPSDRWKFLKKYSDLELHIKCTEQQKYNMITEKMDFYQKTYFKLESENKRRHLNRSNIWSKNLWLLEGSKRKRYLASLKTEKAREILNKLSNKRLICFTGSIEQAKELGSTYNTVHSKNAKKNNQYIIDDFNNKKIDKLFAVGMLQEGMNLNDIKAGIIVQLDNNLRSTVQKIGRVLRSTKPETYIIYYKNTQDEKYLKTAMKDLNKDYIQEL